MSYKCELPLEGGFVTFTGPAGSWLKIAVLGSDGAAKVLLHFAWSQERQPRSGGQRVKISNFSVRVLKYADKQHVQLGIDIPRGWIRVRGGEQDTARPFSTSEFWLEVRDRRGAPGVSKAEDGADQAEGASPLPEPPVEVEQQGVPLEMEEIGEGIEPCLRRVAEPAFGPEEGDEAKRAGHSQCPELPAPVADEPGGADPPDSWFDEGEIEAGGEVEDEDNFDEEEEDEWADRGRKKLRPGRQQGRRPKLLQKRRRKEASRLSRSTREEQFY